MSRRNRYRKSGGNERRQDASRQDQRKKSGGGQGGQKEQKSRHGGGQGGQKEQQSRHGGGQAGQKEQQSRHGGGKKDRGRGGSSLKANMVILVDLDHDYVEMESKAVVNYVSGYNPMGFTDAGRAINYLSNPRNRGRIGLVMLNVDLTDQQDGEGVTELIDMLAADKNALLAVVSETNSVEKMEQALAVRANGLLTKPFTIERFVRFVKGILRTGESLTWQCEACGKGVIAEQIDMLKMKPIKCSDRECGSSDLRQIKFPPESGSTG
ncbi:MAG: response regulator [Candidatus Glassbacteria bacterium]|nr:response regulator [Candidatus Glassbacteria bacterium]